MCACTIEKFIISMQFGFVKYNDKLIWQPYSGEAISNGKPFILRVKYIYTCTPPFYLPYQNMHVEAQVTLTIENKDIE